MISAHSLLARYGYGAVFVAIFLEDFGLPMPGETLLIAASIGAGRGNLSLAVVAMLAWMAAVLGDNVGYLIGRFGGRRLVERYGRYVLLTPARLARAEAAFQRRGGWVVVFARFLQILRQLNGIIAGTAGMRWWRFLLFNSLGAAAWVGFWGTLFFLLGRRTRSIVALVKRYEAPVILGAAGVALGSVSP
jgi:membrane protein DedA with SNARE-associated domain